MPLKSYTLLFVEDDQDTQEQIKMLLEDDIKELFQAYNGEEGLKLYKEKQPDIVITDINLPIYCGLELTAKIKELKRAQPIIIMSGYADKENILNSINLGSAGFIPKPVDVDLLFERLHTIAHSLDEQIKQNIKTTNKIEELYNLAHFDPLTQLPNKFMFDKELTSFIKQASKESLEFALFFIDIDNFKIINDTYGHEIGDFVLQSLTYKISQAISSDDLLARRSGDEFLLLLKNYSSFHDVKDIAMNIIDFTSEEIVCKAGTINPSCSIGISQFPYDTTDKSTLLNLADTAMYNAKDLGKCNYFFAHNNKTHTVKKKEKVILVHIDSELYWHKEYLQLFYKDKEISLTKNEFLFLSILFSSSNYQVSYEKIYLHLWGSEYINKRESVKTLVKLLRKKLPKNFIINVFNIGYKIQLSS
jgi:diguanylate cyclase (GGDEF)-like protein